MSVIKNGFVISLDFELYWGVRDSRGKEYFTSLANVHEVIPQLLTLFNKYNVACTWATVGAICIKDYDNFIQNIPKQVPSYKDENFSPFNDLEYLSSINSQVLFAPNLLNKIKKTKNQEIGSHTFSHYYALEYGQKVEEFEADLNACNNVFEKENITVTSLVFPRNQFNAEYLSVCKKVGYTAYRGNPSHWAYKAENREDRSVYKRVFRLIDCYIPLSGSLRQQVIKESNSGMVNIPASIFFRSYNPKVRFLDGLKLWRLKWSMTRTAKKGGVFHLWWHPHNFGQYINENLNQVEQLLKHYQYLNKKYNFESLTMEQITIKYLEENNEKNTSIRT